jgi:hypothetical protein
MIYLQGFMLLTLSLVLVFSGTLTLLWSDAVGLDTAAARAKSVIAIGTMVAGTLGLVLAGDKALLEQRFWNWVRNSGGQSAAILLIVNVVAVLCLIGLVVAWLSFREIKVYSDRPVVLVDVDDFLEPREIGLLPAGAERDVLMRIGERRIGFRIVGTETVSPLPPFVVPPRGATPAELLFISTKGIRDVAPQIAPATRIDPESHSGAAGDRVDPDGAPGAGAGTRPLGP